MKENIPIAVFCGDFASQPLVFAHLIDLMQNGNINLDYVEVICRMNPTPRLRHYFDETVVFQIEDKLGLSDTCVLLLPDALQSDDLKHSSKLIPLGTYIGHRHVAGSA
ncbi:hypothetical protein [Parasulfitobacter algicola]|uniref:Uncharacterized protein n=1 Tax=Parasulfitobacter algicola TaxID=2614809 RepID=A0ABX2IN86_9RHOB|nr:hypothetical protein [Sulfitobacter algicola]NSX53441.1 hypothetical protein [Sulfitobacter algicola]